MKTIRADVLETADPEPGRRDSRHARDTVAPVVAGPRADAFVPCLPGFGRTRSRRDDTMPSGQQAALAQLLLDPSLDHLQRRLAGRLGIAVPSVTLDGIGDTLKRRGQHGPGEDVTGRDEHRRIEG